MTIALVRADTLCARNGPSLLITTLHGECGAAEPLSGFYCREARVLSTFRVEIDGSRPWVAEAAATAPARLDFNYVHPEIKQPGGGGNRSGGRRRVLDTLSTSHAFYSPLSYHRGSVRAVEQGTIIFGAAPVRLRCTRWISRALSSSWRCCTRKIASRSA